MPTTKSSALSMSMRRRPLCTICTRDCACSHWCCTRTRPGRHAAEQRARLGEGKPETFDFLGFTHFCTRSRKRGCVCHWAQDDQEARGKPSLRASRWSCASLCTTPLRRPELG